MYSEVSICNQALANIRAGGINSFDEHSAAAQICRLKYPLLRDKLLTDHVWAFSRTIEPLAMLQDVDLFNWAHAYQYPADCMRLLRLVWYGEGIEKDEGIVISRLRDPEVRALRNLRRQVPYEVFTVDGNRVIGCSSLEMHIEYAKSVTDPKQYSPQFILALSYLLAAEMAVPLIGGEQGRELRTDSYELYTQYLGSAIADDMNDQYLEPPESEYVTVRM